MVNQVNLVGFVGSTKKVTDNLYTFSVATSESYKDKAGEFQTNTSWHNISCFGDMGEKAFTNISVGDLVWVTGRLSYTKKETKTYTNILLGTYRIIKRKNGDKDASAETEADKPFTEEKVVNTATDEINLEDDPTLD